MASPLEEEEEVFTSLKDRQSRAMDTTLPSLGPLGEVGQPLGGSGEEEKETCVLQFGGRAADTYDHLVPLKGC